MITGDEQTSIALGRLSGKSPRFIMRTLDEFGEDMQSMFSRKAYPAEVANQTYVRRYQNGGLQGSFTTGRQGSDAIFIENDMEAAGFVIGEEQASVHSGRWWQMLSVVEEKIPDLLNKLGDEAVAELLR